MRLFSLSLVFSLLPAARAQEVTLPDPITAVRVVPESYIVVFRDRSFTLDAFREAVHSRRSEAEVDSIVQTMELAVRQDQAGFVADVERLGGRVVNQWWIINAACVEGIKAERLPNLRALANVEVVHENRYHHPVNNTARNSTHHEADQANLRTVGGVPVTGTGVSVAILDTGVNHPYSTTGKPHPAFYIGGNQANTAGGGISGSRLRSVYALSGYGTQDNHGHGTHVSGSSASDYASYRGMAPGASIVGLKISNDSGSASGSWIIAGWQQVAARRIAETIVAANNSFSGSPSITDPTQMAIDSTAINADVLCVVAAGNNGANTTASQNCWNGLAVGSLDKNSLSVSSFSCTGPLSGSGRTYPDIAAVGASVVSAAVNSLGGANSSGTSMASPMVAGGTTLVRQVDRLMLAIEAKAILLGTTKGPQTSRNSYGLGITDLDAAVGRAIAHDWGNVTLTAASPVWNRNVVITGLGNITAAIAWMHQPGSAFENLDLKIYNAANAVVAQDGNALNSYEKASYTSLSSGTFRVEVRWVNPVAGRTVKFGISGVGSLLATSPPTLVSLNPTVVSNPTPAEVTLTGTNLDGLSKITIGGVDVTSFTSVSATQVRFTPPGPFVIGQHTVTATNPVGTSNGLQIQVNGAHPMVITGPAIGARGFNTNYSGLGDGGWITVPYVSSSNLPSVFPGFVTLAIGNSFTDLLQLAVLVNDNAGRWSMTLVLPTSLPFGFVLNMQAITLNPLNLVPPIEASNAIATTFF